MRLGCLTSDLFKFQNRANKRVLLSEDKMICEKLKRSEVK